MAGSPTFAIPFSMSNSVREPQVYRDHGWPKGTTGVLVRDAGVFLDHEERIPFVTDGGRGSVSLAEENGRTYSSVSLAEMERLGWRAEDVAQP